MWDPLYIDSKGKMGISHARSHMSGLPNGGNLTDYGWNGVEGKEV
jgi:hypothetical protein